jgi:hypothetical protein
MMAFVGATFWLAWRRAGGQDFVVKWAFISALLITPLTIPSLPWIIRNMLHHLAEPGAYRISTGAAAQYILGGYWQPSEAGILLFVAAAAFILGHSRVAAVLIALGVSLHSSYLIAGAMLMAVICLYLAVTGRVRESLLSGGLCLLLVLPTVARLWYVFAPTSAELYERAAAILARERIPHHALPQVWLRKLDLLKILLVIAAVWVWRRNAPIVWCLTGLLVLIIAATAFTWMIDSNSLYLLFPWRASVFLVPLAYVLLAIYFAHHVARLVHNSAGARRALTAACFIVIIAMVALPVAAKDSSKSIQLPEYYDPDLKAVTTWVREHKNEGDLYLTSPELETFRLNALQSTFVDSKSHPYRDFEILEWKRRLDLAKQFYDNVSSCDASPLGSMKEAGVTHILIERNSGCSFGLGKVYENAGYSILSLAGS